MGVFGDKVLFFIFLFFYCWFSDLGESDGVGIDSDDLGFSKWLNSIQGKPGLCVSFNCNFSYCLYQHKRIYHLVRKVKLEW